MNNRKIGTQAKKKKTLLTDGLGRIQIIKNIAADTTVRSFYSPLTLSPLHSSLLPGLSLSRHG